jgi:nucleoside-diphosphate-sugar epimerase
MNHNSAKRRIVLFGGTGFLGSSILRKLLKPENEVFTLNRTLLQDEIINTFSVDFLNSNSYKDLLKDIKPDVVISTPWATTEGFWQSESNYEYMRATVELAEIALANGASRFVGLGSSAEYIPTMEDCNSKPTRIDPISAYGKSKLEAGRIISKLVTESGKDFNWLRIFQAYGSKEKPSRLIPQVIKSLSEHRVITIQNPMRILDWVHAEDVANVVDYTIENEIPEHFLDVGTTRGHSVFDVVQKLASLLSAPESLIKTANSNSAVPIVRLVASPDSALFGAGWKPTISLDQGLYKLVNN